MLLLLATAALLAAGCGSDADDDGESTAAAEDSAPAAPAADPADAGESSGKDEAEKTGKPKPKPKGTTIKLGGSQFGEMLFDADDQAIYLFDKETTSKSECYDECAVEWPPVLTKGEPRARGGISQKKLGTTERDDGRTQVTYNGHPLYTYYDEAPGEVRCHNVPGFGGIWLVLDADGNAL